MNRNKQTLVFRLSADNKFEPLETTDHRINFIADLSEVDISVLEDISEKLCNFGEQVLRNKGSFVIVSKISFNKRLNIVPSLQEAYDFIEMEEIERQLNI